MRAITVFNSLTPTTCSSGGPTRTPGAGSPTAAGRRPTATRSWAGSPRAWPALALLLGRRTYQDFHGFWPNQTDNPFTEVLDNTRKYVASTTLREPLPWRNSTLAGRATPPRPWPGSRRSRART